MNSLLRGAADDDLAQPGLNSRPSTILISGRTEKAWGSTPRIGKPARRAVFLALEVADVIISAVAAALPSAVRARPGASLIVAIASTSSVLDASPSEPLRSTMARFGRPVSTSACPGSGHAEDRDDTPTTPAMPITTTLDVPSRLGMLRRFSADDGADLPKNAHGCFPRSRYVDQRPGERVDDVQRLHAPRGRQRAHDRDGSGQRDAGRRSR